MLSATLSISSAAAPVALPSEPGGARDAASDAEDFIAALEQAGETACVASASAGVAPSATGAGAEERADGDDEPGAEVASIDGVDPSWSWITATVVLPVVADATNAAGDDGADDGLGLGADDGTDGRGDDVGGVDAMMSALADDPAVIADISAPATLSMTMPSAPAALADAGVAGVDSVATPADTAAVEGGASSGGAISATGLELDANRGADAASGRFARTPTHDAQPAEALFSASPAGARDGGPRVLSLDTQRTVRHEATGDERAPVAAPAVKIESVVSADAVAADVSLGRGAAAGGSPVREPDSATGPVPRPASPVADGLESAPPDGWAPPAAASHKAAALAAPDPNRSAAPVVPGAPAGAFATGPSAKRGAAPAPFAGPGDRAGRTERPLSLAARALHRALRVEEASSPAPDRPADGEATNTTNTPSAVPDDQATSAPRVWVEAAFARGTFDDGSSPPQPDLLANLDSGAVAGTGRVSVGLAELARTAEALQTPADGAPTAATTSTVLPQIVQAMRVQMRNGVGEARVQLQPDHLGALTVALRIEGGQVTATFRAEAPAVRQWLEGHQEILREALAGQGLELTRFTVDPDGASPGHQRQEAAPSPRRRYSRRTEPEPEAVRFEVIV